MPQATFATSEVVCLLQHRVPRARRPQFRLQSFLLGHKDWETSDRACLHIGEQGELGKLRYFLGDKFEVIENMYNAHVEKMKDILPAGAYIFPTDTDFWGFVQEVEKAIGKKVTFTFGPNFLQ